MSEFKGTPGPWHPGHLGSDGKCQCRYVIDEGYAGGICTIHLGNDLAIGEGGNDAPPLDQAIANMHLIAAAPDLLDALIEAKEVCDIAAQMTGCRADDDFVWGAQAKINAAIAKALGEQK